LQLQDLGLEFSYLHRLARKHQPQPTNQIVVLTVAELAQIGKVLHRAGLSLMGRQGLRSYHLPWETVKALEKMRGFARIVGSCDTRPHGVEIPIRWIPRLSDDDAWDIADTNRLFGPSNRIANVSSLRPNDEFYLMGRVPKATS
jgi:hypothetical protein